MDKEKIQDLVEQIAEKCKKKGCVRLMEVCGTHTVSLFRTGVKSLMPSELELISGPGCPVCVTAQGYIDAACDLAARSGVTVCTYGDMIRVPGRNGSLSEQRAKGGTVMVVYSARDALQFAVDNPEEEVVFLAVGFETTAPMTAAVIEEADRTGLTNFYALTAHKLIVPAMMALLSSGDVPLDGFICPGHVSIVIGANAYQPIVDTYKKPCVVTGFEPVQMLEGILKSVTQVANGEAKIENAYGQVAKANGNTTAWKLVKDVFEEAPTVWRAMGPIDASGLTLRDKYQHFDASVHFDLDTEIDYEPEGCRCGEVIQGKIGPLECDLFGCECSPIHPIGPCMVSSEGTCAAWYKYERHDKQQVNS